MAELNNRMQRSGYVNNLKGFGRGLGGGRSEAISRDERPIIGISARSHFGAGIEPFPTRLLSVSGKNLTPLVQYLEPQNRSIEITCKSMPTKFTPAAIARNQKIDLQISGVRVGCVHEASLAGEPPSQAV